MTINDAIGLRKQFKQAPYIHITKLEQETYFTGSSTGHTVCNICGLNHSNAPKDEKHEWCKFQN